jgi:hypothetical protein
LPADQFRESGISAGIYDRLWPAITVVPSKSKRRRRKFSAALFCRLGAPADANRCARRWPACPSETRQNLTRRPAVGAMFCCAWKPLASPP